METECERLGITVTRSSPYHPQTCGRSVSIERFHQTMKKSLCKREPAMTLHELPDQIDDLVDYYNNERAPPRARAQDPAQRL